MAVAKLVLEDGTVFTGQAFGARVERAGEVVFNTSMTGYVEVLTDPSYRGQLVAMTYPLIGNTGVTPEDFESPRPQVEGFIVRECSRRVSNFRSTRDLAPWLEEAGVPGIEGIDTRALTRRLRETGSLMGVLSSNDLDDRSLVAKARRAPKMAGRDLVPEVTVPRPMQWTEGWTTAFRVDLPPPPRPLRVTALDYGAKQSILRYLVASSGSSVTVLPATSTAEEVLATRPDGVFLSNGPGDPAAVTYAIRCAKGLLGKVPIFGICLGHQILAHALGGKTYKLKFGHHGANHPVREETTGRVAITVQNHGFAVDADSLASTGLEVTHLNLNDGTVEGMRHRSLPVFSVQYHPEASAGPHDSLPLFQAFVDLMTDRSSAPALAR
ncbi:MAG: glutamine-hydrolyzing carbamoyl-phosphate synthase small subunit [Planctomycetes bacterium]|nr:glutamine-hydrolyzing carbamoyl-phosphate synthase small subunit [Planctomycetota bacterium]